jgi:hypothetical protein
MAGCAGPELPVVLAAVEAACEEAFAMHGLLATTHPAGPVIVVSGHPGFNTGVNVLGQGDRASMTTGRALQLVVRNVGGGRPGVEDRAAHGQPGKLGLCFSERLDETAPWPGLAQDRGVPANEPGVTLVALEAPRVIIDQLARDPDGLCASLAMALDNVGTPRQRFAFDALLLVGPEHGRIFREAGWSRAQVQQRLHELTHVPARTIVRGTGGSPEGLEERWVSDPEMPVAKFTGADRILLAYAGGDAGLFSMVFGGWVSGEIGSTPVTRSIRPWL